MGLGSRAPCPPGEPGRGVRLGGQRGSRGQSGPTGLGDWVVRVRGCFLSAPQSLGKTERPPRRQPGPGLSPKRFPTKTPQHSGACHVSLLVLSSSYRAEQSREAWSAWLRGERAPGDRRLRAGSSRASLDCRRHLLLRVRTCVCACIRVCARVHVWVWHGASVLAS